MSRRLPREQLLLPVSPWFIALTLVAALMVKLLPLGRVPWMPDLLAVVLVFWSVHHPRRVGMGWAFAFGLLLDVHESALLGQSALAYAALTYFAITLHRRLLWFPLLAQAIQLIPLFAAAQAIMLGLRLLGGGVFPGWDVFIAPALEGALWPVVSVLLLAPQRRAPDPDKTRPL